MNIFFTADTHFNHRNIIKYCERPFNCVEEMDEKLISNWNSVVRRKDIVYHLGDFCFKNRSLDEYIERLNGKIILIRGNHDPRLSVLKKYFYDVFDLYYLRYNKMRFHLCHYPLFSWKGKGGGSYHLHGHSHGNYLSSTIRSYDVGVDCNNYTPVPVEEVVERAKYE